MSNNYDSDASLSDVEDEAAGQTNVLLGFAEEGEMDDEVSHLGGKPTWMNDASPPPGNLAKCDNCGSYMNLLLQLNGDLPERFPNDARWLYIFGCTRSACNRKAGSVKAFRAVKKYKLPSRMNRKPTHSTPEPAPEVKKPAVDLGSSIFGGPTPAQVAGSNPFASPSSAATASANPFAPLPPTSLLGAKTPQKPLAEAQSPASKTDGTEKLTATFAEKVRISSPPSEELAIEKTIFGPPAPWPAESSFPAPYKHFYLDAEYETLSAPSSPDYSGKIHTDAMDYEDAKGSGAADSKETFESSIDKDFLRFSTRLEHNPEQVLRYDFNGTPILYSTNDAIGKLFPKTSISTSGKISTVSSGENKSLIPRCPYCGGERVFEVQLVPHAIATLEEDRDLGFPGTKSESGMEWETIIVGVCAGNCGADKVGVVEYRQEWVGVQWEEAIKLKQ
ncbi:hypothetical protein KEM54_000662 [Ascosphaera aggregata]|nr:hypothetical protein KEM54_000662 [Ascosphaera aggregata]